jgi:hypothetical protein
MRETVHQWTAQPIYCHYTEQVLKFTHEHAEKYCFRGCPYYWGTAQGEGVECRFYDGTNQPIALNVNPEELKNTMAGIDPAKVAEGIEMRDSGLKRVLTTVKELVVAQKGGAGSGFHGHEGRGGKVGGSALGTLAVGIGAGVPSGEYPVVWSGKPGAGGRGTAVKRAEADPAYKLVRVGGAYHVIDTTPKAPTGPPKPMVFVSYGKGIPAGTYETVYSVPTSKKSAEAKAAKMGPGYVAVRTEGAYHVVKTAAADLAAAGVKVGPSATDTPPMTKVGAAARAMARKPGGVLPVPEPEPETEIGKMRASAAAARAIPTGTQDKDFPLIPINHKTEAAVTDNMYSMYGKAKVDASVADLKALVKDAPLVTNIPKSAVIAIIESGRFKNQHETGTSRGTLSPDYRKRAERNAFGTHLKDPAKDFPIYGYVDTTKNGFKPGAAHYGDGIRAIFSNNVKKRTTITANDSLGAFAGKTGVGTPMLAPRASSLTECCNIGKKPPVSGYVEAQIHGGVSIKDVHAFQVTENFNRNNRDMVLDLRARGFKVEVRDF